MSDSIESGQCVFVSANSITLTTSNGIAVKAFGDFCKNFADDIDRKTERTCWVRKGKDIQKIASDCDCYISAALDGKI